MASLTDELNAVALKVANPHAVYDCAFRRRSPVLARLRSNAENWNGGAFGQINFLYGKTTGGSYAPGATFPLVMSQLQDIMKYDMRFYQQSDVQILEELKVQIGRGDHVLYDKMKIHQTALVMTLNEQLSVDIYRHGQGIVTGVTDNRSTQINGLDEFLSDGLTNGPFGNYYTSYLKQTRNGTPIGTALNSAAPFFGGDATGAAGPITYAAMVENWLDCKNGDWTPDVIAMNKALFGYILERMQPQQWWNEEHPHWGAKGFKFMNAEVIIDEYAPSARYGKSDPKTGSWLTSTFTSVASGADANSNLPAAQTITAGETMYILNTKGFGFIMSSDPLYQFGFSGYKEAQNSTIVAGHVLFAGNLVGWLPYTSKVAYGFNS